MAFNGYLQRIHLDLIKISLIHLKEVIKCILAEFQGQLLALSIPHAWPFKVCSLMHDKKRKSQLKCFKYPGASFLAVLFKH